MVRQIGLQGFVHGMNRTSLEMWSMTCAIEEKSQPSSVTRKSLSSQMIPQELMLEE